MSFLLCRVLGCNWWQRLLWPLAEGRAAGHTPCPALAWVVLGLGVLLGLSCACVVFSASLGVGCA